MFGKDKKAGAGLSGSQLDYVSLLSKDSSVADGMIRVPSDLKISGYVNMGIESAGKVVITETGVVEGCIKAQVIHIHGKVSGEMDAEQALNIYKSGVVQGAIVAGKLSIEEGAKCNMEVAAGKQAKKIKSATVKKAKPATASVPEEKAVPANDNVSVSEKDGTVKSNMKAMPKPVTGGDAGINGSKKNSSKTAKEDKQVEKSPDDSESVNKDAKDSDRGSKEGIDRFW